MCVLSSQKKTAPHSFAQSDKTIFCVQGVWKANGMISERISGSMLSLTCGQEQGAPTPAQMPAATHDSPIAPHDLQTNQKS